jgi:hypothetical protein
MEDIGINWSPPLRGATVAHPQLRMSDITMQYMAIFFLIVILFCWCKNITISTTKYMRGRDISI